MIFPERKTSVKTLKYNSTVEIVVQNTGIITTESHPMHLHGFNFYVLGYGFGNYVPARDAKKLNLVNPQMHNTVGVPPGGWVALRFIANNPGAWIFHCHMDAHLPYGIIMVFIVENGPTPETSLQPPPSNLPQCTHDPTIYESPTTNVGAMQCNAMLQHLNESNNNTSIWRNNVTATKEITLELASRKAPSLVILIPCISKVSI
ncbi:hypothetical protein YC2023_057927 [Brassica napus]